MWDRGAFIPRLHKSKICGPSSAEEKLYLSPLKKIIKLFYSVLPLVYLRSSPALCVLYMHHTFPDYPTNPKIPLWLFFPIESHRTDSHPSFLYFYKLGQPVAVAVALFSLLEALNKNPLYFRQNLFVPTMLYHHYNSSTAPGIVPKVIWKIVINMGHMAPVIIMSDIEKNIDKRETHSVLWRCKWHAETEQ